MNTNILYPVILILAGFVLMILEVLVLPGLVTGIAGFLLVIWGIVYSYQHFGTTGAAISLVSSLCAGTILVVLLVKLRVWDRFVLKVTQKPQDGFTAPNAGLSQLVGKQGVAFTFLRPSGQVVIEGKKYDAMSQASFIARDSAVQVIGISGQQLVVTDRMEEGK